MKTERCLSIAIAGGSGFVGKALAVELMSRDHKVRILARSVANRSPKPNLEIRQAMSFR
jgi:nucleoside-diphosphate-sugar epimerase